MRTTASFLASGVTAALVLLLIGCGDEEPQGQLTMEAEQAREDIRQAEGRVGDSLDALVDDRDGVTIIFPRQRKPVLALQVQSEAAELTVGQPQRLELTLSNRTERAITHVSILPRFSTSFQIDRVVELSAEGAIVAQGGAKTGAESTVERPGQELTGRHLFLGTLPPSASRTYVIEGVATEAGVVEASFDVDYHDQDEVVVAFKATRPQIDIERQLLVDGKPSSRVYACDEVELRYRVVNRGSGRAAGLVLTDPLPSGVTTADGTQQVRIELDDLDPGEQWTDTRALKLGGEARWEGRATLNGTDLSVQSDRLSVVVMDPQAELTVQAPSSATVGEVIAIAIAVQNTSAYPILDAVLVLPDPALLSRATVHGLSDREIIDGRITLGQLAPGQEVTLSLVTRLEEPAHIAGEVRFEGHCVRSEARSLAIEVRGIPVLALEVIDRQDPVAVGERTSYRVRVRNGGSAAADDLTVQAELSGGLAAIAAVATEGGAPPAFTVSGRTILLGEGLTLAAGETREWEIPVEATAAGEAHLSLQVAGTLLSETLIEVEPTSVRPQAAQVP